VLVNFLLCSKLLLERSRKILVGSAPTLVTQTSVVGSPAQNTSESVKDSGSIGTKASRDSLSDGAKSSTSPDRLKVTIDPANFETHWQSEMEREFTNLVELVWPYLSGVSAGDILSLLNKKG
jgi:hypothetical protein